MYPVWEAVGVVGGSRQMGQVLGDGEGISEEGSGGGDVGDGYEEGDGTTRIGRREGREIGGLEGGFSIKS